MRHPILTALAALLLALGLSGAANAGPFEDALAAHGRGDYATALRLWQPLADQGNVDAQYKLGVMFANGEGVKQDYVQAVKWFRLAADHGHAGGQFNLGFMYGTGLGVPQDDVQAVKWYRLAADQGYARAQFNLGLMYAKGEGVPEDNVQAHKWFNLAGAGGDEGGRKYRDIVATKMTPAQIAEAQRLAHEWRPRRVAGPCGGARMVQPGWCWR